jgi:glycosyltransferase involved in cell wall biosynthesis
MKILQILRTRSSSSLNVLFQSSRNYEVGVVIPCHNPGMVLTQAIERLDDNISQNYELVLVLDNCRKNEIQAITDYLELFKEKSSKLAKLSVVTTFINFYETRSDNEGFKILGEAKYVIELQADILIKEMNFDKKYLRALEKIPDLFAISGRGIQGFVTDYKPSFLKFLREFLQVIRKNNLLDDPKNNDSLVRSPRPPSIGSQVVLREQDFYEENFFGLFGENIESIIKNYDEVCLNLYLGHSIFRGPIFFDGRKLRELEFLNEKSHRLGNDDHEICSRAWVKMGWRVGYIPLEIESRLSWGATRRKKSAFELFSFMSMKFAVFKMRRESFLYSFGQDTFDGYPKEIIRNI